MSVINNELILRKENRTLKFPMNIIMEIKNNFVIKDKEILNVQGVAFLAVPKNMVLVERGSFNMGTPSGGRDNERPVHKVTFTYDYMIGKYEVTFNEYDKFCEETGRSKPNDEGWGRGERPVINEFTKNKKVIKTESSYIKENGKNYFSIYIEYEDTNQPKSTNRIPNNNYNSIEFNFENEIDKELYEKIKAWRKETALKEGIPVFLILNNSQLKQIILKKPDTKTKLEAIKGFGAKRSDKYSKDILTIIKGEKIE